jgi:hypothetical protein
MFPRAQEAIREHIYPAGLQERAKMPNWVAGLEKSYPSVTGKNPQERINWLFENPRARGSGLPLKLADGSRLVVHATTNWSGGRNIWLEPIYTTPGEMISEPFLGLPNYRNMTMMPSGVGKPQAIMVYSESGFLGNPAGSPISYTHAGYKVAFPKEAKPTSLWESIFHKTEIEALMPGQAQFQRVAVDKSNLSLLQRLFLPAVGGTPYYYKVSGPLGGTRTVPAYLIGEKNLVEPTSVNKTLANIFGFGRSPTHLVWAGGTGLGSSGYGGSPPSGFPYGASVGSMVSSRFTSYHPVGYSYTSPPPPPPPPPPPSYITPPSEVIVKPLSYLRPGYNVPTPTPLIGKPKTPPSQVDYYNELRKAWNEVFGAKLAPQWKGML